MKLLERSKAAQAAYSTFTQEQVDVIFKAAAMAANGARIPLAKMACSETGMGVVEDKVIKNHFASEYIYNRCARVRVREGVRESERGGLAALRPHTGMAGLHAGPPDGACRTRRVPHGTHAERARLHAGRARSPHAPNPMRPPPPCMRNVSRRYKDEKTCGIIEHDEAGGMTKIAEPVGVVAGGWVGDGGCLVWLVGWLVGRVDV